MVTLQLRQLDVPPGQRLVVRDLPWAELELILTEMGDHRAARIAYPSIRHLIWRLSYAQAALTR
jgi:hypothetical protein